MQTSCSLYCTVALWNGKEQNTFPSPKASPGRPVGSWGSPGLGIVSCVNLCPPVSGHHNSVARLSQTLFLWLLSRHLPSSLFYSTMIVKAGRKEWGGAPVVKEFLPFYSVAISPGISVLSYPLGKEDGLGGSRQCPMAGDLWDVAGKKRGYLTCQA